MVDPADPSREADAEGGFAAEHPTRRVRTLLVAPSTSPSEFNAIRFAHVRAQGAGGLRRPAARGDPACLRGRGRRVRLLLDTHTLLWVLGEPERIAPGVRQDIEDMGNAVLISAVCAWRSRPSTRSASSRCPRAHRLCWRGPSPSSAPSSSRSRRAMRCSPRLFRTITGIPSIACSWCRQCSKARHLSRLVHSCGSVMRLHPGTPAGVPGVSEKSNHFHVNQKVARPRTRGAASPACRRMRAGSSSSTRG